MDYEMKMKAAIAGVIEYLRATEDKGAYRPGEHCLKAQSAYAMNGRQTIMQMRALLQRRVLRRR